MHHDDAWARDLARVEEARAGTTDPVEAARLDGAVMVYRNVLHGDPMPGAPVGQVDLWRWEGILATQGLLARAGGA